MYLIMQSVRHYHDVFLLNWLHCSRLRLVKAVLYSYTYFSRTAATFGK